MKVFLSNCTKDKGFVEKLAGELRAVDIEPWLCEVDVLLGDDFVAEIEKGLKEADVTVLVWSPDAARSAWTGKEWRSVLAREIEESRTRLLLVRLRDADVPELLRTKHRTDARSDPERALRQTVKWLISQRDMRLFAKTKAANFILDFEPTGFVGRTVYLEQLHTALVEERGKFLLWGEAGCGKSMLALKFAWRAQGAFDAVVFQHCGQRPAAEIGVELAERIGLDVKELAPDKQITEAKKWLSDRRTLLVLDDIWGSDVKELIPSPPFSVRSLSVLCTSRQRSFPWVERPRSIELKSFVDEEAESLFHIYLGEETTAKHLELLLNFSKRVEGLPIAVAVAAEMLSRQFGPLDEEAQALELEKLRNDIHDIPELLQHAITTQPEREQGLLQAMAVCHPDGFRFPLAASIAGLDKTNSRESRDQLVNSSLVRLVDRDQQRFRLHALLRGQLLKTPSLEHLQKKYTEALYELFEHWEDCWKECRECLSEIIPAIHLLWNGGLVDRMQWLAHRGFAAAYRGGELDMALRILKEEETFWKNREDPDAKDSLQITYGNQASILKDWGRLDEAMELLKKVEALCLELGNKNSLQATYGNQALILKDWGRLDEAMELHKKEEALCLELGIRGSLGYCYWNWGLLARAQQDRDTEREKLQAALQIFTELNMPREQEAVREELNRILESD